MLDSFIKMVLTASATTPTLLPPDPPVIVVSLNEYIEAISMLPFMCPPVADEPCYADSPIARRASRRRNPDGTRYKQTPRRQCAIQKLPVQISLLISKVAPLTHLAEASWRK